MEWSPLSDIMTKYSTPIELNQADDYNKYLMDSAQKITTETTNDNGVIKTYTKKFDTKDAKILLASSFGYDPNKPLEEQFASNAVPVKLNHWYYQNTGRKIENNEDFGKAIDASVEQMRAAADEKVTTEVKKTAADLLEQNLRIAKTKAQIKKLQEVKAQELSAPAIQPSNIRLYDSKGQYIGRTESPAATVNIPGTQNFLSAKPYVSKDGKTIYNKYFVGGFAPDGTIIHNEVKNPISVLSAGKSKDNVKIIADLNRLSAGITPVSNANPIKIIKDKKDDMYRKTNINLKAKVTQDNYKRDFENSIYGSMVEE